MDGPPDEFIQCREIRHQTDAFAVSFQHEERGAAPRRGFIDGGDDLLLDQLGDCFLGLWFIMFKYPSSCRDTNWDGVIIEGNRHGGHLIGSGLRSSLSVLSNRQSSFVFRDESEFGCFTVRAAFGSLPV